MHATSNVGNSIEVAEHPLVTINVCLENFPIINARLPRSASVSQNETRLDLFRSHRHRFTVNAVGIQMNRADPSIKSWVVVLAPGGHVDDLGFDILGDDTHLFEGEVPSCEPSQRGGR